MLDPSTRRRPLLFAIVPFPETPSAEGQNRRDLLALVERELDRGHRNGRGGGIREFSAVHPRQEGIQHGDGAGAQNRRVLTGCIK